MRQETFDFPEVQRPASEPTSRQIDWKARQLAALMWRRDHGYTARDCAFAFNLTEAAMVAESAAAGFPIPPEPDKRTVKPCRSCGRLMVTDQKLVRRCSGAECEGLGVPYETRKHRDLPGAPR